MRYYLLIITAFSLSACTLSLQFDQCSKDADCPMASGKRQFCTSDRICTIGTPVERMCGAVYPKAPMANAVPVGAILTLPTDNLSLQALQLAIDEINALSGSGQRPLTLYICNVAGTGDDALKAMKHLGRERGAVAVVGPTSSSDVIAVAAEAGISQVPLVSPSATAPAVSNLPQRGFIFRVAPSDEQQGKVLGNLVAAQSGSKLALLFVDDAYGKGLQESFLASWVGLTGKMPVVTESFKEGDSADVDDAADKARAMTPTDVVAIAYLDTATLVRRLELIDSGMMRTTRIWMADGAKGSALLELVGQLPAAHFARIRGTAPTVATGMPAYLGFRSGFQAKYGMDPSSDAFSAYSYDALYAIAIAIANGRGAPTGPLVSAGLRRISGADALTRVGQSSYLEAVRKMSAGMAVPLDGASGEIRWNERGDRQKALFEQWSIDTATKLFTSTPAM